MQYHPTGKILQVESAIQTVNEKGSPAIAVRCTDGIILVTLTELASAGAENENAAADSLTAPAAIRVLNNDSYSKCVFVDKHICVICSGLAFDGIAISEVAKSISLQYRQRFAEDIPLEALCDRLSSLVHKQTQSESVRPLAASVLIAGVDAILGPQVYSLTPDGSYASWHAASIGRKSSLIYDDLLRLMQRQSNSSSSINASNNSSRIASNSTDRMGMLKVFPFSVKETLPSLYRDVIKKRFALRASSENEDGDDISDPRSSTHWSVKVY
jgi:20S proteasome subunit alpha 1